VEKIEQKIIMQREVIRVEEDIITNQKDQHIVVAGTGLFLQQDGKTIDAHLSPDNLDLALFLFNRLDKPFLDSRLVNRHFSAADRFSSLTIQLGTIGLEGHMVKVGRRYGVLRDDSDPKTFAELGRESVKDSEKHPFKRAKGMEAFNAFEALYEGKTRDRFSKKRVLGTTAIIITIGGVITYAKLRHKPEDN
jgi:hypothetical protein